MLNINTLARPYAKAAYEFSSAAGQVDAWSAMLAFTAAAVTEPAIISELANPKLTREGKVAFLKQMCEDNIDETFGNFLRVLGENGRLTLLPTVQEMFEAVKAEANRTVEVEVQSAFELSAEQLQTLAAALSKRLDRTVEPKATVNPALIGGLHIRAGDLVIDGSIRGRLNKLAEALKS